MLPGQSLAQTIRDLISSSGTSAPVDITISLAPGVHNAADLIGLKITGRVTITGEQGAAVSNAILRGSSGLAFSTVVFQDRVLLDGANNIGFTGCSFKGIDEGAALEINGQGRSGPSYNINVSNSVLRGGGRTVFVLGAFGPSEKWNHSLTFDGNHLNCGSKACFQISGGRDIDIRGNTMRSRGVVGVLTAGAKATRITRNRFVGNGEGTAMQIATPGWQWDPFSGVEHMVSSQNLLANNIVMNWGVGIMFAAAVDTDVVFNSFSNVELSLFMLNHKPTDPQAPPSWKERPARAHGTTFSPACLRLKAKPGPRSKPTTSTRPPARLAAAPSTKAAPCSQATTSPCRTASCAMAASSWQEPPLMTSPAKRATADRTWAHASSSARRKEGKRNGQAGLPA